jgi:hypothetical protein
MDTNVCCDDDTLDPNGPVASWFRDLLVASEHMKRPAILGATLKGVYEKVGFVDIHQKTVKMPIGGWPRDTNLKEVGLMWGVNLHEGLSAFSYQLFNRAFDRTPAEIEVCITLRAIARQGLLSSIRFPSSKSAGILGTRAHMPTCLALLFGEGSRILEKCHKLPKEKRIQCRGESNH